MIKRSQFRYFKTSPEIIRLAVMMYIGYPLSLRNVEDLLHERGIDICHETVRFWWNRFGPMFAAEIRKRRVSGMRSSRWRWHLDEVFVKINGELHYLWRAVDHEGEVLESFVTKTRGRKAALKFLKKTLKRHGHSAEFVGGLAARQIDRRFFMTINHRFAAAVAFAFALGIATTDAAFAACGVSGEYCNGDPNHSAMDQLTHADEGLRDETFDGNQQGH